MPHEQRKTINAKEAANDIRSGMTEAALMTKYGLSPRGLQILARKLVDASLLEQHEFDVRASSAVNRATPITWKCPACGAPQTRTFDECPNCGVIVSKFRGRHEELEYHRPERGGSFTAPAAGAPGKRSERVPRPELGPGVLHRGVPASAVGAGVVTAQDHGNVFGEDAEDMDDRPLEPRKMDRQEWLMLLVGPVVALVCLAIFWFSWILGTFRTLVHEMGHAIFGWGFGYPSLPAFDFLWGGGVTLHIDRSTALLVLIYLGFAGLVYMYRKNTTTVIVLVVVALLHALFSFTDVHSVIILFMGHGTELIIGGLFIYRSLSGRAIVHPAERPLYAVIGFFLIFSDISLGFSLLTSPDARAEYLAAKGGDMDMDFIRIARDHLHVKMNSVVFVFLLCSVIAPVVSFLAFRYEEYIHSVIAALWAREPAVRAGACSR